MPSIRSKQKKKGHLKKHGEHDLKKKRRNKRRRKIERESSGIQRVMEGEKQEPRAQEEEGKGLGLSLKEKRKKEIHLLADIETHMEGKSQQKGEKEK